MPSLAVASFALASAIFILAPSAPADSQEAPRKSPEVIADGTPEKLPDGPDKGMPASNPLVRGMLSSHPGEMVTICVAGCEGRPQIVQALPKPRQVRTGEMRPTSAHAEGPARASDNAVVCLGGCAGRPGQVVQRLPMLPPPQVDRGSTKQSASEPWYDRIIDDLP